MKTDQKRADQESNPAYQTDINETLMENFHRIVHAMRARQEGKASQKRILAYLLQQGPISQRALTRHLQVQPGTISEVLLKMEKKGWIVRKLHPKDKRTALIELSASGKLAAAEAAKARSELHGSFFSTLTEEEKQSLLTLLEKIDPQAALPSKKEYTIMADQNEVKNEQQTEEQAKKPHGHHGHHHHAPHERIKLDDAAQQSILKYLNHCTRDLRHGLSQDQAEQLFSCFNAEQINELSNLLETLANHWHSMVPEKPEHEHHHHHHC